jgi:chromosome segregation ATPase
MELHIHHHGDDKLFTEIKSINQKLITMAKTQAELAAEMNQISTQLTKVAGESKQTLDKVKELEEALNNQENVSPELQSAFDNLKAQVLVVDDLIPDVTTPTEPTELTDPNANL